MWIILQDYIMNMGREYSPALTVVGKTSVQGVKRLTGHNIAQGIAIAHPTKILLANKQTIVVPGWICVGLKAVGSRGNSKGMDGDCLVSYTQEDLFIHFKATHH